MADLPTQRQFKTPPFLHCGMNVFGPFLVRHGKQTRFNPGTKKVWVLLVTCLYSRAVHLEILDSMTTESFKMAFQRFQDMRGECTYLRSDHGSNFMGARNENIPQDELNLTLSVIQDAREKWTEQGRIWELNPPKASHAGGIWERKIGAIRQCIDTYLQGKEYDKRLLDMEEFRTMLNVVVSRYHEDLRLSWGVGTITRTPCRGWVNIPAKKEE